MRQASLGIGHEQQVASDVEFPAVDEQRALNILLHDEATAVPLARRFNHIGHMLNFGNNLDAKTAVAEGGRLDDPNIGQLVHLLLPLPLSLLPPASAAALLANPDGGQVQLRHAATANATNTIAASPLAIVFRGRSRGRGLLLRDAHGVALRLERRDEAAPLVLTRSCRVLRDLGLTLPHVERYGQVARVDAYVEPARFVVVAKAPIKTLLGHEAAVILEVVQ
mmetsp:Transcript_37595/g.101940  ORF Transcript_37595/g.101940 Transcript_37595/m.101940 type:complete len:223 (-) Transcript_37595:782-1450(-)